MFNVHALGGEAMMRAARSGADRGAAEAGRPAPLVLAVTVLSSQSGEGLASPASLAFEAKASGLDGVVVSGEDVETCAPSAATSSVSSSPASGPQGATVTTRCAC